jgi:hypothetical protein
VALSDDLTAAAIQAEELEAQVVSLTSERDAALTEVDRLTAELEACQGGEPEPAPAPVLMLSATPDRANPQPLAGAGSLTGNVYVFAESQVGPVTFLIDGAQVRVEATAPYDLAGGTATAAAPFDTRTLSDGGHNIQATTTAGTTVIPVAVKNATTPPPEPEPGDPFNPPWLDQVGPRADAIPNVPASAIRCTTLAQVAAAPANAMIEVVGTFNDATLPLKSGTQKVWARQLRMVGADNGKLVVPQGVKGYTIYGGDFSGYHGLSRKGNTSDARRWAWLLDGAALVGAHVHHMRRGGVAMMNGARITDGKHDHNPSFDFSGCNEGYVGYCDLGEGSGGGGVHPDGTSASDEGICKTAQAQNMTYEYNWGHDVQAGNGLWSDINNRGHRWYRNLLEDIPGIGIDLEISCDGEILENICRRVGRKTPSGGGSWPTKSSIDCSNTPDTTVIGNAIEDTDIGFATFNSDGHEGWTNDRPRNCCLGVRNLLVQRNHFRNIHLWVMGITGSIPPEADRHPDERCGQKQITDPASNNRFVDNDYPATGQFNYKGQTVSRASWESHGYS